MFSYSIVIQANVASEKTPKRTASAVVNDIKMASKTKHKIAGTQHCYLARVSMPSKALGRSGCCVPANENGNFVPPRVGYFSNLHSALPAQTNVNDVYVSNYHGQHIHSTGMIPPVRQC